MSFEQFAAAQSAPLSALQSADPTKETTNGLGRPLTFDEFQKAQGMTTDQLRSWKIPALPMPTIRRDVTSTPADLKVQGKKIETPVVGALMRQLVDPVLEHPVASAAFLPFAVPGVVAEAPLAAAGAAVIAGANAVQTIARYGWTKAHELAMTPEDRAKSEADPNRVSGEAAAVQAAMLGLAPLVHVGLGRANSAIDVSGGMVEAGAKGAAAQIRASTPDFSQAAAAESRGRFAAQLESGAQNALPVAVKPVKGLEPTTIDVRASRNVKPIEGLIVPDDVTPGRVKPLETESVSAPLQEAADVDQAKREYEAQRVSEDQSDLAAQRQADAERVLGLSEPEQDLTPRRRPGGQKPAPYFESPQGAEVLGAMAARHGLPEDANPYHPQSPLAPEWQAGHDAAAQSYPAFPEGFSMGGALTDNRIPSATIEPIQGLEPTAIPEGATPETAQLAAALKPSRFRGHSTDELVRVAQSARETIDRGQREIDVAADNPAAVAPIGAERAITRANGTLAQVEREFALRGITGDKLARLVAPEDPAAPSTLTSVEGTGVTRTRGLAAGVQEKALANHLDVTVGDLPEYRTVSMADQAQRAASLIDSNPDFARRVATGAEPAPRGLLPESVFVAVEQKAIAEGDVATLRDLATSKLTSEATTMGQRIRALAERDPDSPVAAIQDVIDKRSGGAKNATRVAQAANQELSVIRDALQVTSIERSAWSDFVKTLTC